jgi:hypothetical protein
MKRPNTKPFSRFYSFQSFIKIGAKVTRHAKHVTFQLAEVAVQRELFTTILERIKRLAMPLPSVARAFA